MATRRQLRFVIGCQVPTHRSTGRTRSTKPCEYLATFRTSWDTSNGGRFSVAVRLEDDPEWRERYSRVDAGVQERLGAIGAARRRHQASRKGAGA